MNDLVKRLQWAADRDDDFACMIELDGKEAKSLLSRIEQLERALREIIEQDDVGDLMYRKDGPCAVIARIAFGE